MPIVSAIMGSHSASKAADAQVEAARYAADIQKQMFEKGLEVTEPWRQAGMWAIEQLIGPLNYLSARYDKKQPFLSRAGEVLKFHMGYGPHGLLTQGPPEFDFEKYKESPWYQFPLQEGQKAITRRAAAHGRRFSGQTMKNLLRYGQDYAMGMYMPARQQEFSEWVTGKLNPLLTMAGMGQVSAGQQASNALQTGRGIAGSNIYGGEARASGILGSAAAMQPVWQMGGNLLLGPLLNPLNQLASGVSTNQLMKGVGALGKFIF